MAWEQYGSRAGKKAIDQALNNVITFDLISQALCSNYAKSCYDRSIHSVAAIAMRQQNIPASACVYVFTTL
jgi:hypothetical protein